MTDVLIYTNANTQASDNVEAYNCLLTTADSMRRVSHNVRVRCHRILIEALDLQRGLISTLCYWSIFGLPIH